MTVHKLQIVIFIFFTYTVLPRKSLIKTPFIFSYRYHCFVLGMLFGIAVRSGSPLSLNIAEPVWKQLAGMPALTISDLSEVDKDFVPGMMYMYIIKDFLGSTVYVKKIKITICNLCGTSTSNCYSKQHS
jgi:hypothetical protein